MLVADYHTHTNYSHGTGTPEENVLAAIARGLPTVAISEHGPKHAFFGVRYPALLRLRKEIDRLQDVYGDRINIQMGLEANLLGDGITDAPASSELFDFILIGYHRGTWPADAAGRRFLLQVAGKRGGASAKQNALSYTRAMENTPKVLGITHPGTYIPVDIAALAIGAKEHGVALEINESHQNMTEADIRAVCEIGATLFISSDAHRPAGVGACERSIALAKRAGVLSQVMNWQA